MFRNRDRDTGFTGSAKSSLALPMVAGGVEIGILGNGYGNAGGPVDLAEAMGTFPAGAIAAPGRIGIGGQDDGKAFLPRLPIAVVALPARAIAFGMGVFGNRLLRLGKGGESKSQQKSDRQKPHRQH